MTADTLSKCHDGQPCAHIPVVIHGETRRRSVTLCKHLWTLDSKHVGAYRGEHGSTCLYCGKWREKEEASG